MSRHLYPTLAEAIEIHRQLIDEFGGIHGLHDRGRIEAAIFRPQLGYYDSLLDEAAALMESLANNHAFLDGNKRLSFALTDTFLRMNGHFLAVDPIAGRDFIEQALARGAFRFRMIRDWIEHSLRDIDQ